MSNEIPPTLPGSTPNKKGLPPLAWVGIGCGGLLVLALVVIVISFAVLGNKVKKFAEEAEKNPQKVAAEMVVKFNPDLELINSDDAQGKITFREKSSGKEMTLSYQDISDGKFSIESGDQKVTINTDETKEDAGTMVITSEGHESTFSTTQPENLPEWVSGMIYPNAPETKSLFTASENGQLMGTLSGVTTDSVDTVASYYKAKFKEAGYEVADSTYTSGDQTVANITGSKPGTQDQQITITVNNDQDTITVNLIYQGKE